MPSIAVMEAAGSFISANAGTIATVAGAAGAGLSAYESHQQGVAASNMAKQKARVEALNAQQQQIDMRQKMLRALASQNAGTLGAVATGAATSFGANTRRQITQAQNDLLVNQANASAQASLLDQQAQNDIAAGNAGAAVDIFKGVSQAAGFKPPPGSG